MLYGLTEAGARRLQALGIPAESSASWLRPASDTQYHHRRLANEVIISAKVQGYNALSEREIALGKGPGGIGGINGKRADGLVRKGRQIFWCEAERSRKNLPEAQGLRDWINSLYPANRNIWSPAPLPNGQELVKIVFVCTTTFEERLTKDLLAMGWNNFLISHRISFMKLLYMDRATFISSKER